MIRYVVSHCRQRESNETFSNPSVCCGFEAIVAVGEGVVEAKYSCNGVHIMGAVCWFISVILYVPESDSFDICALHSLALWN